MLFFSLIFHLFALIQILALPFLRQHLLILLSSFYIYLSKVLPSQALFWSLFIIIIRVNAFSQLSLEKFHLSLQILFGIWFGRCGKGIHPGPHGPPDNLFVVFFEITPSAEIIIGTMTTLSFFPVSICFWVGKRVPHT